MLLPNKQLKLRRFLKKSDGFTLIEVLLALALMSLIIAVLTSSFMQIIHTQEMLNGRITAAVLGAGKLAELEQGSEMGNSGTFLEPYQKYRWLSREETLENGSRTIILTVEWDGVNRHKHQKVFQGFIRKQ